MDVIFLLPTELFRIIFDILNDNVISIISLVHVNKKLHKIVSSYGKIKSIDRISNCVYAASTNQIEVLKWAVDLSFPICKRSCIIAAKNNNLDMLKWLLIGEHEKIVKWNLWSDQIASTAALNGCISILKWILNNVDAKRMNSLCIGYALHGNLCDYAVQSGNLDLMILLQKYKFPLGIRIDYHAILGGHMHILEWLKEQNYTWSSTSYYYAMIQDNIKILDWLKNNGCPIKYYATPPMWAGKIIAKKNNRELLQWINNNGFPWNTNTIADSARYGTLETVKWLRNNGCPWNRRACQGAASGNNLSTLIWLRENGCPWNVNVCSSAAFNGNLEMLKWARENGCPWNKRVIINARTYNHYDIEKWALENECPDDDDIYNFSL